MIHFLSRQGRLWSSIIALSDQLLPNLLMWHAQRKISWLLYCKQWMLRKKDARWQSGLMHNGYLQSGSDTVTLVKGSCELRKVKEQNTVSTDTSMWRIIRNKQNLSDLKKKWEKNLICYSFQNKFYYSLIKELDHFFLIKGVITCNSTSSFQFKTIEYIINFHWKF